jgi:hypothetical protein
VKKFLTVLLLAMAIAIAPDVNAQSYPPEIEGDMFAGTFSGKLWLDVFEVGYSVPGLTGHLYQKLAITASPDGRTIYIDLQGVWYTPIAGLPEEYHQWIGESWTDEPTISGVARGRLLLPGHDR